MLKRMICAAAAAVVLAISASGCGNTAQAPAETTQTEQKAAAKVGCLSCIGLDEDGVRRWTEDVAEAEGRDTSYTNTNDIIFFDDVNSMVLALKTGKIDRLSTSYNVASYIVNRNDDLEIVDKNYPAILGYSMALPSSRADDAKSIDEAIAAMKEDGTIDRLVGTYITDLGKNEPEPAGFTVKDGRDTIKVAITGDMPSMDLILADGSPAGFNTAFLAELSDRIDKNIELVSVNAPARAVALASGEVDAIFWMRGTYDRNGSALPYLLDKIEGIYITKPYLMDRRVTVIQKAQ